MKSMKSLLTGVLVTAAPLWRMIRTEHYPVRKLTVFLAVAMLFTALPSLHASMIYNNGGPNGSSGNEMTQWIQAEDFVLSTDSTLLDVHFWSFENQGAYQGSIVWQIYSNNAGNPGAVLFSGTATPTRTADPAAICCGFPIGMDDSFLIPAIALTGGTQYWLALHNGPLTTTDRLEFYWATANKNGTETGHEQIAPFGGTNWFDNFQEHAFNLTGDATRAVPEPATILLVGFGLAGLAARHWKSRTA